MTNAEVTRRPSSPVKYRPLLPSSLKLPANAVPGRKHRRLGAVLYIKICVYLSNRFLIEFLCDGCQAFFIVESATRWWAARAWGFFSEVEVIDRASHFRNEYMLSVLCGIGVPHVAIAGRPRTS